MLIYNEKTKSVSQETAIRVPEEHEVVWIHLHAPMATELTHILCDLFHCHPLIVEDCVMLNQRPKLDPAGLSPIRILPHTRDFPNRSHHLSHALGPILRLDRLLHLDRGEYCYLPRRLAIS